MNEADPTEQFPEERVAAIEEAKAHNEQFAVDHSKHIDADGVPCMIEKSWTTREARDLDVILTDAPSEVLARVKAEAWEEGRNQAKTDFVNATRGLGWPTSFDTPNPYRAGADHD